MIRQPPEQMTNDKLRIRSIAQGPRESVICHLFRQPLDHASEPEARTLRASAEAGVVVQIEHIKPGDHIVTIGSDILYHFA